MENKVYNRVWDQVSNQVYKQIFSKIDLSIDHLEYSMIINRVSVDAVDRIRHEVFKKLQNEILKYKDKGVICENAVSLRS